MGFATQLLACSSVARPLVGAWRMTSLSIAMITSFV